MSRSACVVLFATALATASVAGAHDLSKTNVSATFQDGTFEIVMRTDADLLRMQLRGAGQAAGAEQARPLRNDDSARPRPVVGAELAPPLARPLQPSEQGRLRNAIVVRFDDVRVEPTIDVSILQPPTGQPFPSRVAIVRLRGAVPPRAHRFQWSYALLYGPYALTLRRGAGGVITTQWLSGPEMSEPFPLGVDAAPPAPLRVATRYVGLGFTHILPGGFDHILFVLGLCLLSRRLRPLLSQVSAFTVAHSVTLGLSMYGVIAAPAVLVEPLIAASIALVALENLFTSELKPWRIVVVFAFGLLHGLGFASALGELGLPRSQFLPALVSFNVGVEAGQMCVVAIAFGTLALCTRVFAANRRRIAVPLSAVIAAAGIYWTIVRVMQ